MNAPLTDFIQVFRAVFRFLRYAGLLFLVVTLYLIGREVASAVQAASAVHPALGVALVILVAILVWRLIGVPVWRFLRMPVVLSPPKAPAKGEPWRPGDVAARHRFLGRYLDHLERNRRLADSRPAIREARRELIGLERRIAGAKDGDEARKLLARFEQETMDPLLAPLDREADRVIRAEALSVGISTAISPNGTLDAFLVLWRNANLVSRLANIYYGKPGVRGSLKILSDVSTAALFATYLEGLSEAAGGLLRGVLGSVAGVLAGPVVDGAVNALATLRIGHLAKFRCRSFRAWTDATRAQAVREAFAAAKARSAGVVQEIGKAAGAAVSGVGGKMGDAVRGGLASMIRKFKGSASAGPE